jgi:hypothetical protein
LLTQRELEHNVDVNAGREFAEQLAGALLHPIYTIY